MGCGRQPWIKQKPTAVASRGFLSKSSSASTSTDGRVGYDDQQYDLSIHFNHQQDIKQRGKERSSVDLTVLI